MIRHFFSNILHSFDRTLSSIVNFFILNIISPRNYGGSSEMRAVNRELLNQRTKIEAEDEPNTSPIESRIEALLSNATLIKAKLSKEDFTHLKNSIKALADKLRSEEVYQQDSNFYHAHYLNSLRYLETKVQLIKDHNKYLTDEDTHRKELYDLTFIKIADLLTYKLEWKIALEDKYYEVMQRLYEYNHAAQIKCANFEVLLTEFRRLESVINESLNKVRFIIDGNMYSNIALSEVDIDKFMETDIYELLEEDLQNYRSHKTTQIRKKEVDDTTALDKLLKENRVAMKEVNEGRATFYISINGSLIQAPTKHQIANAATAKIEQLQLLSKIPVRHTTIGKELLSDYHSVQHQVHSFSVEAYRQTMQSIEKVVKKYCKMLKIAPNFSYDNMRRASAVNDYPIDGETSSFTVVHSNIDSAAKTLRQDLRSSRNRPSKVLSPRITGMTEDFLHNTSILLNFIGANAVGENNERQIKLIQLQWNASCQRFSKHLEIAREGMNLSANPAHLRSLRSSILTRLNNRKRDKFTSDQISSLLNMNFIILKLLPLAENQPNYRLLNPEEQGLITYAMEVGRYFKDIINNYITLQPLNRRQLRVLEKISEFTQAMEVADDNPDTNAAEEANPATQAMIPVATDTTAPTQAMPVEDRNPDRNTAMQPRQYPTRLRPVAMRPSSHQRPEPIPVAETESETASFSICIEQKLTLVKRNNAYYALFITNRNFDGQILKKFEKALSSCDDSHSTTHWKPLDPHIYELRAPGNPRMLGKSEPMNVDSFLSSLDLIGLDEAGIAEANTHLLGVQSINVISFEVYVAKHDQIDTKKQAMTSTSYESTFSSIVQGQGQSRQRGR